MATDGFRFDAKKYLLTYSQVPEYWSLDYVYGCFTDYFHGLLPIKQLIVGEERHMDGGKHYHVFIQWPRKFCSRNTIILDIEGHHPNIKTGKNTKAMMAYAMKDGKYLMFKPVTWNNWTGYLKDRVDFEHWSFDNSRRNLADPLPLLLPQGYTIEPDEVHKKRHWWFTSRPDWGKTLWINRVLAGKRFWYAKDKDLAFEGYTGEPIVVFNDTFPSLKCLIECSEVFEFDVPVYGRTRYRRYYWGRGVRRWILVFTNHLPEYSSEPAFQARVNVVDLDEFEPYANRFL